MCVYVSVKRRWDCSRSIIVKDESQSNHELFDTRNPPFLSQPQAGDTQEIIEKYVGVTIVR